MSLTEFLFIQWLLILILGLAVLIVTLTRVSYRRGRYPYALSMLIYLSAAIAILFGILIFLIATFFTEPYVTHDTLLAAFGALVALILMLFVHLNHRIDAIHTRIDNLYSSKRRR